MNDDKKHNEQDEISRRLKDLPRVKASPDFEARLQRKIASSGKERERKSLFDVLFFPRRVPVFATSILALFAVSVISYYVFVKSSDESSVRIPSPPTIAERSEPQQSNQTGSGTMDDKATLQDVSVQKKETSSMKEGTVTTSSRLQAKPEKVDDEEMARTREPNIELEEQATVSVQADAEQGIAVQQKSEPKDVQQNIEMKAAEPAQEIQQKMAQPLQQLQKMKSTQEKFSISEFSAAQKMRAGKIPDSVRIADSLRQDSIKKALQKQLLQKKQ
jgi:hypothetical protein